MTTKRYIAFTDFSACLIAMDGLEALGAICELYGHDDNTWVIEFNVGKFAKNYDDAVAEVEQ